MTRRCTAESAQTGRERGDKEKWIVYSEIRIVKSLEALQLLWHHFLKVKIFAGQKGSFFLLNCRNKGRKSERSDRRCTKALISFYEFAKFWFVFIFDTKLFQLGWSQMAMLLLYLICPPRRVPFTVNERASVWDVSDNSNLWFGLSWHQMVAGHLSTIWPKEAFHQLSKFSSSC